MTEYMIIKVVADALSQFYIHLVYISLIFSLTAIILSTISIGRSFKRRGPYKKRPKEQEIE